MRIGLVLFTLVLAVGTYGQMPCPADLAKVPGRVVVTPPKGLDPTALRNVRQAIALLERSAKGFSGGETRIYTSTFGKADTASGIYQMYEVAMYFLQYECVGGIVKPEAATDLWVYISFNRIPFFESNNSVGYTLSNGQSMFYSKYKLSGTFKDLPMLSPLHHPNGKAVWMSEPSRLPLRSITKAELLPAYREAFFKNRDETINRLTASLATEQRDLNRIDTSPNSPADKDRSRKALLDSNTNSRKTLEQFKSEKAACAADIESALSNPASRQPAFVEFVDTYCKPDRMFIDQSNPRAKAVSVFDDSFFDRTKAAGAAQYIVVYWRPETGLVFR